MDFDTIETLGKIAGIAGIAFGVLLFTFRGVLQKNIFPKLDQRQGFVLIRNMIIAASLLAALGLGAWIYVETQKTQDTLRKSVVAKSIVGVVQDENGAAIANVKIEVTQFPNILDYSDHSGKFVITVSGKATEYIDLILKHKNYEVTRKKVKVNYASTDSEIALDPLSLKAIRSATPEPQQPVQQPRNTNRNVNTGSQPTYSPSQPEVSTRPSGATINLVYAGDSYGCTLDININVAGQSIRPTGNSVLLHNVPTGDQDYSVTGRISCGTFGFCDASGSDEIYVEDNATYYVMWQNQAFTGLCDIGLVSQEEFNAIRGF